MVVLAIWHFLYQYPVKGVNHFSSQVPKKPMIFISEEANPGCAAATPLLKHSLQEHTAERL
jgi:hypothetical protein